MIDALETSHLIEIRDFNKMSSLVDSKKGPQPSMGSSESPNQQSFQNRQSGHQSN